MEGRGGVMAESVRLSTPEILAEVFEFACDFAQTVYIYSGCQTEGDGCSVIAVFNGEGESC